MKNKKKIILGSIIGVFIGLILGTTYAIFSYTRTGGNNQLQAGRIVFSSNQTYLELNNALPTTRTNLNSSNSDTATITLKGDTTYTQGIEYKVTIEEVNNTINGKELPITFQVTANNLGTKSSDYYNERGSTTNVYKLTEEGDAYNGKYVIVGFIKPDTIGVDGSIDITAYIDTNKIIISDTISETDTGAEIFTTSEWNSFNSSKPLSFKVKVEAREGTWVEHEEFLTMKNLNSDSNWTAIRANITSIEFHKDGIAPANYVTSFDVTDSTSDPDKGNITLYTVDDGLGNDTYRAIVVANDIIYAPENSLRLFRAMTNLVSFNSKNFRVDNVNMMQQLFQDDINLQDVNSLSTWDTSRVSNMVRLFFKCQSLENIIAIKNWNVSSVESMEQMFYGCVNLKRINFSNWNVENVENMSAMFCNCLNLIDFSSLFGWKNKTGNVADMSWMFGMDANKTGNPVIDFSPLANWNVSNVTNMMAMFQNVNIKSYNVFINWNVGKVQDFNNMFNATRASTVTTLAGLENWDVSSATNMGNMFADNVSLTDSSAINDWNINANTNFTNMFVNTPSHPEFSKFPNGTWSNGTFTPNA